MKCADIMTMNPGVCMPEDNVSSAVEIMWNSDCGVVPVVKDMESKEIVGIVTDRDIAMHVVKHACAHPYDVKVCDCMTSNIIQCQLEDPVETAIQLMSENQIRRIPVVESNGACVGIISQANLLLNISDIGDSVISLLQNISTPRSKPQQATINPEEKRKDEKPAVDK